MLCRLAVVGGCRQLVVVVDWRRHRSPVVVGGARSLNDGLVSLATVGRRCSRCRSCGRVVVVVGGARGTCGLLRPQDRRLVTP